MASKAKQDIITFKVDESLSEAMKGIQNRSAFIRDAVLNALENGCPLCMGTGVLTPDQKRHWERFALKHSIKECPDCHAYHIVCEEKNETETSPETKRTNRKTRGRRRNG